MIRKIALTAGITVLIGAGIFALGRLSVSATPSVPAPIYSLAQGSMGMLGSDSGYVYSFDLEASPPSEEVIRALQDFLMNMGNPDLAISRLREFEFAYQAEIIEQSTGQHAFDVMFGKATWRISPQAGPNVFWNIKYGSMIAEIGGGYGMVGRLIPSANVSEPMPISETEAEALAEETARDLPAGLELGKDVDVFYGYYEFYLLADETPAGELDVNGFSGQVWLNNWGKPQIDVMTFGSSE